MFTHTVLGTNDVDNSRAFYTAVMGALGQQTVPLPHGTPGVRENAPSKQYGAYLRDTDGNKICAFAPNPNA